MNRRLAAIVSLLLLAAAVVLAVIVGVQRFPRGLTVLACVVAALAACMVGADPSWPGARAGAAGAGLLLAGAIVLVVIEARVVEDALILVAAAFDRGGATGVYRPAKLPAAPAAAAAGVVLQPEIRRGQGRALPRRA